MRATKITFERLKKNNDANGQEVMMLRSKLSLAEVHLGAVNARLHHIERKAYEARFNECKALAVQILPVVKVRLL